MHSSHSYTWAWWVVSSAPTFEGYINKALHDYDACLTVNTSCPTPRILNIGLYDKHIDAFLEVFPRHFFCIVANVYHVCNAELGE